LKDILFSIILPTFNRAHIVENAIKSVLSQNYEKWELIIVDDGSSDDTKKVISKYLNDQIRYHYQENAGESKARNTGIDLSNGDYIFFLDDDDYYLPGFLMEFYLEINKHKCPIGVFMCDQYEETADEKRSIQEKDLKNLKNPVLFLYHYGNLQPLCFSKSILIDKRFDEHLLMGEDFHLFLRLMFTYPLFYFPKPLCVYRIHQSNSTVLEYQKSMFTKHKNNRLDTYQDLFNNYKKELNKTKSLRPFIKGYNKTVYFYASHAMKNAYYLSSFRVLRRLKWSINSVLPLYYFLSITLRTPFYFIKNSGLIKA